VNSGTAEFSLSLGGAESGYAPGQVYTVTVTLAKAGMQAAGFQIIALLDSDLSRTPGNITLTDPSRTQKVDVNNPHAHGACTLGEKVWVEHTYDGIFSDANGQSTWSFQWAAPDEDLGSVTFYAAGLETDFDLTQDGDLTYELSTTIGSPSTGVGNALSMARPTISAPMSAGYITLSGELHRYTSVTVSDATGRKLLSQALSKLRCNGHDCTITAEGIARGAVIVTLEGPSDRFSRIVMLH
jgi:hypothetical protein